MTFNYHRSFLQIVCIFCVFPQIAISHARWKCPLPRDDLDSEGKHIIFENSGNHYAACGPLTGQWGVGTVTSLKPGWTTLVWEESVSHKGSPFRIALLDGNDVAKMILLDHIPHNDMTNPIENVESTYAPYRISIYIPDVNCPKCALQLLYPMTDQSTHCGIQTCYYNPDDSACKGSTQPAISACLGAPNDNLCRLENQCFSSYHSCTDVTIRGVKPLATFQYDQQPVGWPYANLKMQHYSLEAATWKGSWLQVPNMSPTYEPFITDFETLSCDRNILKTSFQNNNNSIRYTSWENIQSYGIVFMIIIAFSTFLFYLAKRIYHERSNNNNLAKESFSRWIEHDIDTSLPSCSDGTNLIEAKVTGYQLRAQD